MYFCKLHGLGNDFILIKEESNRDYSKIAKLLCDRHFGIGGDGLLVVNINELRMHYFNKDGSKAKMCGNGLRCFAYYLYNKEIINNNTFQIKTDDGRKSVEIDNEDVIIDFSLPTEIIEDDFIIGKQKTIHYYSSSIGVNHTVIFVTSYLDEILLYAEKLAKSLNTNIDYVLVVSPQKIKVKTYELGCGWTKSCGTGSSISAYISYYKKMVEENISVYTEGGTFSVLIDKKIQLKGQVKLVCEGDTYLC